MINENEILKRILLNMRYDSSMTLNENRIILEQPKPKITVDKPEFIGAYEYKTELMPDGGKLTLPQNAKILSRFSTNSKPKNTQFYCEKLIKYDPDFSNVNLNSCVDQVVDKYKITNKKNSVTAFEVDGKKYIGCYSLTDSNKNLIPLKDQKFFSGYSTSCNPPGETWEDVEFLNKPTNDIRYDDEWTINLDMSL